MGPRLLLRSSDIRRLEMAIGRMERAGAALQAWHAAQVDMLSQRLQVVVAEAGVLRAALDEARTSRGRMDSVVDALSLETQHTGRRAAVRRTAPTAAGKSARRGARPQRRK